MNQLDFDHMRQRLDMALTAYIHEFERKHGCEFDFAVSTDLMGVICTGDECFGIDNIIYDIENDLPERMIYQWYHASVDRALVADTDFRINLASWHKGARYAD
jgi:hypothetical protein